MLIGAIIDKKIKKIVEMDVAVEIVVVITFLVKMFLVLIDLIDFGKI